MNEYYNSPNGYWNIEVHNIYTWNNAICSLADSFSDIARTNLQIRMQQFWYRMRIWLTVHLLVKINYWAVVDYSEVIHLTSYLNLIKKKLCPQIMKFR